MIIIWRGNGILVPIFFLFFMGMALFGSKELFGDSPNPNGHYVYAAATMLAAISVWFAGRKSNANRTREAVDERSGRESLITTQKHTFFLIPAEYWAFPLGVLAIYYLVTPSVH